MKGQMKVYCFLLLVLIISNSYADIGDVYDLGDALWDSVEQDPPTNPYTEANEVKWTFCGDALAPFPNPVLGPDARGWTSCTPDSEWHLDPWSSSWCKWLLIFIENNEPKTNYQPGDIGGLAPIAVQWKTLLGGTFKLDISGYNARNQALASGNELGRTTQLVLSINGVIKDSQVITGGIEDGSANAYTNSMIVNLLAGDIVILEQTGSDWCGMSFTATQIDPNDVYLLAISTDPSYVDTVLPYANGTPQVVDSVIDIEAQTYVDCDNGGEVLIFDHWEAIVGDMSIANPTAAATTVQFNTTGPAEIRAVYVDGRVCGDECHPKPKGDLTGDCRVNLDDLALLSMHWMESTRPEDD